MAFFLFGFGNLIYISILLLNSIAILSEDRFLARIGWGHPRNPSNAAFQSPDAGFGMGGGADPDSVKSKVVNLISSVRTVCRMPLILVNVVIIVWELALG